MYSAAPLRAQGSSRTKVQAVPLIGTNEHGFPTPYPCLSVSIRGKCYPTCEQ